MRYTRRTLLAGSATSLTLGLAGCLGDDGTGAEADTETTTPDAETTPDESDDETTTTDTDGEETEDDDSSATVQVRSHDEHGDVLVGPDGMTLYMFDQDAQGEGASVCYEDCAENWPPLTVEDEPTAGDDVAADLTTFERDDGSMQVAADGWPLYYFASDEEPGDVTGQGVGDVWWVLDPDGTPVRPGGQDEDGETSADVLVRSHDELGDVLVGPDEMTLYMFDQDEQGAGESACTEGCADSWPPLTVENEATAGDGVAAELTTFERDDGSIQVAAAGWPLYYFAPDEDPGDANGQGANDVWWVLAPDGTPKRSDGDDGDGGDDGDDGDGGYDPYG